MRLPKISTWNSGPTAPPAAGLFIPECWGARGVRAPSSSLSALGAWAVTLPGLLYQEGWLTQNRSAHSVRGTLPKLLVSNPKSLT